MKILHFPAVKRSFFKTYALLSGIGVALSMVFVKDSKAELMQRVMSIQVAQRKQLAEQQGARPTPDVNRPSVRFVQYWPNMWMNGPPPTWPNWLNWRNF